MSEQAPFQEQFKDVKSMSEEELIEEVQMWRRLWTWIEEDVKYYLTQIGSPCRVILRNYQGYLGRMLQPHFKLSEVELETVREEFNYEDGHRYMETKVIRTPITQIVHLELISEREVKEETPIPEGASSEAAIEGLE